MDWLLEQSEAGGPAAPRSAVLVGGDGDLVLQALSMQARSKPNPDPNRSPNPDPNRNPNPDPKPNPNR